MQLITRIDVFLPGNTVERSPTVLDKVTSLWQSIDLKTDRVRDTIEAATFVYEFRRVLGILGIDNARSLIVEDVTVFHDSDGTSGDLDDLILALSEHETMFGEGAQDLRLSVECEEAAIHFVLEAKVTTEHRRGDPSARITVLGQLMELNARPGESPSDYRERIAPICETSQAMRASRLQFSSFVSRLQQAICQVFPNSNLGVTSEVRDMPENMKISPSVPPPRPGTSSDALPVRPINTAAPARNFTLTTEQQVGALVSGPPRYSVRLCRIEDLEEELVSELVDLEKRGLQSLPRSFPKSLEELNKLIEEHNRYYPVECNLPFDVVSGQLLEMGGNVWKPRPRITVDDLRLKARSR